MILLIPNVIWEKSLALHCIDQQSELFLPWRGWSFLSKQEKVHEVSFEYHFFAFESMVCKELFSFSVSFTFVLVLQRLNILYLCCCQLYPCCQVA